MATLAERAAAAQARLAPKTEQRDANASSSAPVKLSKALQAEADYDGPVDRVELDGLAVLKILQHASGSSISTNAAGFLFGLSLGSRLSISNSFPLPANHLLPTHITTIANVNSSAMNSSDEKIKAAKVVSEREKEVDNAFKSAKTFIGNYAPRAKELNLDSEVVGGYFVAKDGMDLLKEGILVDILIRFQFGSASGSGAAGQPLGALAGAGQTAKYRASSKGGKRGVAIVYGKVPLASMCDAAADKHVDSLIDASSSSSSSLGLKAYGLSPSFLSVYESASHRFDYAALAQAGLSPSNMLITYPVSVTSSSLLTAFLAANPSAQQHAQEASRSSYGALSADDSLETNLKSLIGAMDSANNSLQSLAYQGRSSRGYGAQQSSNIDNLNRLESLKTLAVAEGAAKSLGQEAGLDTVKAWAAKGSFA